MTAYLDHVAINSGNYKESIQLFEQVFHMTISRETGAEPHRQAWFHQGIQINETADQCVSNTLYHHIALRVSDQVKVIESAKNHGCTLVEGKHGWIATRDGIVIELLT